jgi:hypothetical protein
MFRVHQAKRTSFQQTSLEHARFERTSCNRTLLRILTQESGALTADLCSP